MLHFHSASQRRPQTTVMSEKEFQVQTDLWYATARSVVSTVPSLDFIGWHGEHFVVERNGKYSVELKDLPARRRLDCGTGVDLGSEDAAWLERKDVPIDYEMPGLEHFENKPLG